MAGEGVDVIRGMGTGLPDRFLGTVEDVLDWFWGGG